MPKTSGGADQVISLPKGGGTLQGLGETFQPDLHTGTGNFSVPIAVPPGRNGLQPQLALTYSTGQGNGPFGLGWSLSVPGVTRKTAKGVPRYQGDDVYVLSGAEDLVLVEEKPVPRLGMAWGWGSGNATPGMVSALTEVVAIAAGGHSLALAPDGTVWAWGGNGNGQLGDGTTHDRPTPVPVQNLSEVVAIAVGMNHSLALKADGTVWAWGYNAHGQLGLGTTDAQWTPVQVPGLSGVVAITAGNIHNLALKADGTVWAWGGNGGGALGDGTGTTRLMPVPVQHLSGVVTIAAGAGHSLALRADGTVWAWGLNTGTPLPASGGGQLGDGTMTHRSTPVQVVGLRGVVAIAAGGGHSLACTADGAVWAWGVNVYGQVGDGTTTARHTPVPVGGLTDVVALAAGYWHSLALTRPVSSPAIVETMPPLAFQYTTFAPVTRRFFPLQGRDLPARSLASPDLELVDLFGNGLPDILHGYWDGAEREFRGFGMVERVDSETFDLYNQAGLHGAAVPFTKVKSDKRFSPPTLTRTWFHQGPIGEEFGDWQERDLSGGYWAGDPQVLKHSETVNDFLKDMPRRVQRDALRTLRSSILRTELYALDGSELADRPYTVTESLYGLREVLEESSPAPDDAERPHIFFPHVLAQRTTQWERGRDPMTQFTFTGEYDRYGQPCSQISVAVPRGRDYRATIAGSDPASAPYLATHTVTVYATPSDPETYIVDRVARTTTYEVPQESPVHRQDVWAFTGLIAAYTFSSPAHIISQSLHFYDGPAFEGLPFGIVGAYGALVRTETLVLTEDLLHQVYRSGETVTSPPEAPPYLVPHGPPVWTADYPQGFRNHLLPLAGYHFRDGSPATPYTRGYFAASARRRYDFHEHSQGLGHGLVLAQRDPLGRDTIITYDAYDLLPIQVTDPAGLTTRATYDYRVLQPKEVTEPNGNRTAYAFTPLGLLERIAVMGKAGENVGDTLDAPGTRLVYDFLAFAERRQPISVRTIKRVHHVSDTDTHQPEHDETMESMEYSDGFGRLLQTRTQAEDVRFGDPIFGDAGLPAEQLGNGDAVGRQRDASDPPHVVVSGWQIYDNKGRVVKKYEPFFSVGWDYATPQDRERGQKVMMFYDPRGQVIRTINPDGSEQLVIYGIPKNLDDPPRGPRDTAKFLPTPWETYTYDANDNAGRTHPTIAAGFRQHWNTPASAEVDALGRTIKTVTRNGPDSATDWYTTRSAYDIRGNLLTVTDALGRVAFRHVYDLANRSLRIDSLDAGTRRSVLDAAGNVLEERDSKGALVLRAYDVLHRPIPALGPGRQWSVAHATRAAGVRRQPGGRAERRAGHGGEPARQALPALR